MHLICPSKFCITFVFHFSWVLQPSQEKLKTMLMQNFGGQIRYIMGKVEVAYSDVGLPVVSAIFANKVRFKLFFLNYVNSYCENLKIALLIKVCLYLKYQEIYVATFWHSNNQLSDILGAQSGQGYLRITSAVL